MAERPEFRLELSQNKYLSTSDKVMDAVLTVTGTGGGVAAEAAEVLLVDCSSSMDWPPTKIDAARRATRAAIDTLRDGVFFGVVQGTLHATMVYPDGPRLVPAGPETRAAAKAAVAGLIASGQTAIGRWLALAGQLLDRHPDAVRHAVLLTDGRNEFESEADLAAVLASCAGRFVCDARGIGDDWDVGELERIAVALQGSADAVVDEAELAADFRKMIGNAMRKVVPELRLRITTMPFTELRFVKQVHPSVVDLTERCVQTGPRTYELTTGPWAAEDREYHLCLEVRLPGRPMGEDFQLGKVELATGDRWDEAGPVPVVGHVTEDVVLFSRPDPRVERHTVQQDLGHAVRAGWDAFEQQDRAAAAAEWGTAVRLATGLGNEEILRRLRRLVDVEDAAAGRVRLRDDLRRRDLFSAVLGSNLSGFGSGQDKVVPELAVGAECVCVVCAWVSPPGSMVCVSCGERFPAEGS
ncbi:VWA domain-containing protein [Amycolatopsis nigrescens]|uniref:VWA domain-containing protein n=1 Tax=Amycolatopsis nigrescens TaxID=381445 RepID=UPI00035FEFDF|nr:vWA domain-containing protein [Amycolatopsis nigrescens]